MRKAATKASEKALAPTRAAKSWERTSPSSREARVAKEIHRARATRMGGILAGPPPDGYFSDRPFWAASRFAM